MPRKKGREYEFDKQKKVGDKGEKMFLEYYPECKLGDGVIADFTLGKERIELKTDTWSMEKTENFFMEYYSDQNKETLGGPFRAEKESVDWFVYLFIKEKVFYWFRTKELVKFLKTHIKNLKYKTVQNKAWTSTGYAVKREDLDHLVFKQDDFGSNEPF